MYVCNCRVAKVNDDDDDVSNATRNAWAVVSLLLLLGSTTNPSPPLSLSSRMQKCLASTIAHLQPILHLSISSSRLQISQTST